MPRISPNPDEEAQRLRDIRKLLGMSQRELADELKVAHGAISQWENGERSIPGPVLRLLDIYEENLGMVNNGKRDTIQKIHSSWVSRTLRASMTTTKIAARLAESSLKQLAVGNEKASQIKAATEEVIAKEVTESLGEMKGLLMKMGQIVSYMDFALPEHARALLASLQDSTTPMDPAVIRAVIVEEFGAPPEKVFKEWSAYPIAAASIGQVHRAKLQDGTEVAVKVQYPEISKTIQTDLSNAVIFDQLGSLLFRYQDKGAFVEELKERLLEECDYENEASNLETFRKIYAGESSIVIPEVYRDFTTKRVLTTEFFRAKRFNEFISAASQAEKDHAGELLFRFAFNSIFKHRIFNCDPHPGNYLFDEDRVIFLDFGCVRRFDPKMMETWIKYARAVLEQNRKEQDRGIVDLRYAPRPEKFDFDYQAEMMRVLYEPWLTSKPFRFNRHFVKETWRAMVVDNRNKYSANLPKEWVFINRLQWGLYSVLAELEAQADWRGIILACLYEPGESPPQPLNC